jgi:hypothetical protein
MSLGIRSNSKHRMSALALVPAGILFAMPAAEAHVDVGLGINVPPVVAAPPAVVAPPAIVAPPPVVVVTPPYYYAPPGYYAAPGYYTAPAFGFSWYDSFGHRHWDHDRWGHDHWDHNRWGHDGGGHGHPGVWQYGSGGHHR